MIVSVVVISFVRCNSALRDDAQMKAQHVKKYKSTTCVQVDVAQYCCYD